jgi:hypothetical protein
VLVNMSAEREHREFVAVTRTLANALEKEHFGDRVLSEHIVRVLDAVSRVLSLHPVDDLGRCEACRHSRRWLVLRRRAPCAVHDTFAYFLMGRNRR